VDLKEGAVKGTEPHCFLVQSIVGIALRVA
jgi:hypothetical protein